MKEGHLRVCEEVGWGVWGIWSLDFWLRRVGISVMGAGGEPEGERW